MRDERDEGCIHHTYSQWPAQHLPCLPLTFSTHEHSREYSPKFSSGQGRSFCRKKREREREEEVIGGHLTKVNERTDVRSMFVFSSSSHIVSPLLFVTFGFFFPHIFDCFGSPIGVNTERSPHPNKLPDSHRGFSPENPLFFLNIIIMITAQPAPISQLDVYVKLTRTWEATLPVFSSSSSHIDYGNVQTFLFVLLSTLPKEKQQNKKLT